MKWIITGGCGFIGSHCAKTFLDRGDEVIIIDNLSRKGSKDNLVWLSSHGLQHFYEFTVTNDIINGIFELHEDVDAVLHLAAQVAVTTSIEDPLNDFKTNALGSLNVLEAIRKYCKKDPLVIYASTNKVYGSLDYYDYLEEDTRYECSELTQGVTEMEPLEFHSPYGCSKGAADQYFTDYARIYGMNTVVLRQSCIYGERQFGNEDQGWLAWFTIAAHLNKEITIYGNGKQVRDILFVDDLVALYSLIYDNKNRLKGEVFNVGGGKDNTISVLELCRKLNEQNPKDLFVCHSKERQGDQKLYVSDIRKLKEVLNWKPRINIEEGLDLLIKWTFENLDKIKVVTNQKEG